MLTHALFVGRIEWQPIFFWMRSEFNDSTPQEKNTLRDDGYCYAVGPSRLVQNTCQNFLGNPPLPPNSTLTDKITLWGIDVLHKKKTFLFVSICACLSQRWNWGEGGCHYHWTKHTGSEILLQVNPATSEDTPLSKGVFFSCGVESLNSFSIGNWKLQSDSPSEQSTWPLWSGSSTSTKKWWCMTVTWAKMWNL